MGRKSGKIFISNSVQVFFGDGSATEKITIDYPVGHRRRREEGIPLLREKFERHLRGGVSEASATRILSLSSNQEMFETTTVNEMMGLLRVES